MFREQFFFATCNIQSIFLLYFEVWIVDVSASHQHSLLNITIIKIASFCQRNVFSSSKPKKTRVHLNYWSLVGLCHYKLLANMEAFPLDFQLYASKLWNASWTDHRANQRKSKHAHLSYVNWPHDQYWIFSPFVVNTKPFFFSFLSFYWLLSS